MKIVDEDGLATATRALYAKIRKDEVTKIELDENNNVFVTLFDGTQKNIGKLDINIPADFLTSVGFGGLRYYDNKFQSYSEKLKEWVDITPTSTNVLVAQVSPQPMKDVKGTYDKELGHFKLRWEEPNDTIIDGQIVCVIEKIIIKRKLESVPSDIDDGELVAVFKREHFGTYKEKWYIDETITPELEDTWHYKIFPVSSSGFVNSMPQNRVSIQAVDYELYGFVLNQNESDPDSMITYIKQNDYYRPAHMDYTNDVFDYGDWENAWFIKGIKPVLLNSDCSIRTELDPDNYTKDINGQSVNITNINDTYNVMIGIPKVYWKIVDNGNLTANIYFCNKKLDDDFVCWPHVDYNGNEIDYCYIGAYNGYWVYGKLRSLSLQSPDTNSLQTMLGYASFNGTTDTKKSWEIESIADWCLINLLLLLIGKSTNTQKVFGYGHVSGNTVLKTGTMNDKGLFYGTNKADDGIGVKIFGIENWWGNIDKLVSGLLYGEILLNGSNSWRQAIKLTYGQSDGSNIDGYNTSGEGYLNFTSGTYSVQNGAIKTMTLKNNLFLPGAVGGVGTSTTTYWCDRCARNSTAGIHIPICGGSALNGSFGGAFCMDFTHLITENYNAYLTCRPAKVKEEETA